MPTSKVDATDQLCGIIMPISTHQTINELTESHWRDVRNILTTAASMAQLSAAMVSESADIRVIMGTVVENLAESPIVICDISGLNSNVMFELGLRLAFGKPTVVVKDRPTSCPFDFAQLEYLEYPRDLRHPKMEDFKAALAEKLSATLKAVEDGTYKSFLSHFKDIRPVSRDTVDVAGIQFLADKIDHVLVELARSRSESTRHVSSTSAPSLSDLERIRKLARSVAKEKLRSGVGLSVLFDEVITSLYQHPEVSHLMRVPSPKAAYTAAEKGIREVIGTDAGTARTTDETIASKTAMPST